MWQLFRGEAGREGRVVIFQGNVYVRHLGNGIDSEPQRERERGERERGRRERERERRERERERERDERERERREREERARERERDDFLTTQRIYFL